MASAGVRVSGLRETVRSLEKFGIEVADLKAAFNKIGSMVADDARTLAPTLTGRLAASIRPSKTKNKSVISAGRASIPYAGVIHYGGYNNITANPFLENAVARNQDKAVDVMETELNRLIRELGLN